jgi:hypothetical protein
MRSFVLAAALCCAASCGRKAPEINGIGQWALGTTRLREAPGFCSPDALTFCSGNGAVPLGEQVADVNLYFRGDTPEAPLVEIELTVRRCDPAPLLAALSKELGEPDVRRDAQFLWRGTASFIAGRIPAEGRRCEISFVAPDDATRIAELSAPPAAPPASE